MKFTHENKISFSDQKFAQTGYRKIILDLKSYSSLFAFELEAACVAKLNQGKNLNEMSRRKTEFNVVFDFPHVIFLDIF